MSALRHERSFLNRPLRELLEPALRDFYEAPGAHRRIPFGSDLRVQIADQQPPKPTFAGSGRLTSSRPLGAARRLAIVRHSAVIRKQLDWVVEAAHRIFADALEIEIAFDEVGERAGQQHRSAQLFGE